MQPCITTLVGQNVLTRKDKCEHLDLVGAFDEGILGPELVCVCVVSVCVCGVCVCVWCLCVCVCRSMLPDVVDDFKVQNPTSTGLEPLFFSCFVFFNKFGGGLAVGVSTLVLQ